MTSSLPCAPRKRVASAVREKEGLLALGLPSGEDGGEKRAADLETEGSGTRAMW
eukprot:CAMPEP_0202417490 /NCGR_PEP_ID=MMETSP1128-20130828/43170_1 /ASSEMBLY_ACC=CAM_ASM_000463 /TAXON_ID=3047 /ORGANISM="Dunaliella tertiolecta, Strain CCMP1320" /LENGTH=53 /DNA_ID=CAMNT_0049024809 /DNA_START=69 /DNA_END=227 /DNA_ORIENTATION=+